jgi:hypothetical protein
LVDYISPKSTSEGSIDEDGFGQQTPFGTLFENAIWSSGKDMKAMNSHGAFAEASMNSNARIKRSIVQERPLKRPDQVCALLKSALPDPEDMRKIMDNSRESWVIRQAMMQPMEKSSLEDYIAKALQSDQPLETAKALHFFAEYSDENFCEKALSLIDQLIIQDEGSMSSIDGLECAVFQGKLYSDIGQPRRSWLSFQRAIMHARLLGLHLYRPTPQHQLVWHTLFLADRFLSLTLGTSYTLGHSNRANFAFPSRGLKAFPDFNTDLAVASGKITDLIQNGGSLSETIAIDNDLIQLAGQKPQEYWELEPVNPFDNLSMLMWYFRVLEHFMYYLARMILHLPEMLKGAEGSEKSRATCFYNARQMLAIFHRMRAPDTVKYYKCKGNDFTAFCAAVVLVLGILEYGYPEDRGRDWTIIEQTMEILKQASTQPFGKVAGQCYQALQKLTRFRHSPSPPGSNTSVRVVIPCFGVITVTTDARNQSGETENSRETIGTDNAFTTYASELEPIVWYDGVYVHTSDGQQAKGAPDHPGYFETMYNWSSAQSIDRDEDWSWPLNSKDHDLTGL